MRKERRIAAAGKIALLISIGTLCGTAASAAVPAGSTAAPDEPIALKGQYYFYTTQEADDGPICAERRWFGDDGTEFVASGEEIAVKRFRVEDAKFGATLFEIPEKTNGKPDCLGNAAPGVSNTEQQSGMYRAQHGNIVLYVRRVLSGGTSVAEVYGRLVQSSDDSLPPPDLNASVAPPPNSPSGTVMAASFPGLFNRPVPAGPAHRCDGYYPPDAESALRGGVTLLAFSITGQGGVSGVKVVKSSGQADLDSAAMACVKPWQYAPVVVNGQAVKAPWLAKVAWYSDAADTSYQTDLRALRRDAWNCLWASSAVRSLPPKFVRWLDVHIVYSASLTATKIEIATPGGNADLDAAALDCVRHAPALAGLEKNRGNIVDDHIRLAWWNPAELVDVVPETLIDATKNGDLTKVTALIAAGADVNARDDSGGTSALDWAARKNYLEVMEVLLAHGADVRARDFYGFTPLHHAAAWGSKDGVELLLAHGADVNDSKNGVGDAPIHYAIDRGHEDIIKLLLDHGADINARNKDGETPLLVAAKLTPTKSNPTPTAGTDHAPMPQPSDDGIVKLVKFLLTHKADITARDKWNNTPLHRAAWEGDRGVVELLLANGADVNAKNIGGMTPLKNAEKNGHDDVATLLRQHGAGE